MTAIIRPSALLCIALLLGACGTNRPGGNVAAPTSADQGVQQAFFAEPPDALLLAAAEACVEPGQFLLRPGPGRVTCESLPMPEIAAALILRYEGTVSELPRYVISFAVDPLPEGYLVTTENFIRVPQRQGPALLVRLQDPLITQAFGNMLTAAGGTLIPTP